MYNRRVGQLHSFRFSFVGIIVILLVLESLIFYPKPALSAGVVNLTWEISDPANTVKSKIYRNTTQHLEQPSATDFVAEVLAPTSTYQDTAVTVGQTYYYSIFEFDSGGTAFDPSYFIYDAVDGGASPPPATPPVSNPGLQPGLLQAPAGGNSLLLQAGGQTNLPAPSATGNSYPVGTLVKAGKTIYLVTEPRVMVGFTNLNAFKALGYSLRNVVRGNTNGYAISKRYFISSTTQSHPWSAWVIHQGTVYYVSREGLIPVPSYEIFQSNGGQGKFILKATPTDLQILQDSPSLPPLEANDLRVIK